MSRMTAVWDIVQEFLTKIGELKDPEYYGDALRYMKALIGDIHDIDHKMDQKISNTLWKNRSLKDIEEFMRRVKRGK